MIGICLNACAVARADGMGNSDRTLDQQGSMFGFCNDFSRLIDQRHLLGYNATAWLFAITLVDEDDPGVHYVAGKEGRLEAHLVPAERCDRGALVHLTLQSLHQREAIKTMGDRTAETGGLAIHLVRVQRMVIQGDIGKSADIVISYDMRRGHQFSIDYYVIVIQFQGFRLGHRNLRKIAALGENLCGHDGISL